MEYPLWYKVLEMYENRGYIRNGLTFSFLIGITTEINSNRQHISTIDFFEDIKRLDKQISVLKCDVLDEYVFGIMDSETQEFLKGYFRSVYKVLENIVLIDDSLSYLNTYKELCDHFINYYSNEIREEQWSINEGKWSGYTDLDKDRLSKILI